MTRRTCPRAGPDAASARHLEAARIQATQKLASFVDRSQTVGLAVAAVTNGALVYTASFGRKSLEEDIPLRDGDLFRIASVSKSFTATALLRLLDQGTLRLDDDAGERAGMPIRNPKHPGLPITVRMLLSHTSSLNDSRGYGSLDLINPAAGPDWARSYRDEAPGARYEYANIGFHLLGAIIERVSGTRFDRFVRQSVIAPLALYASFNPDDLDRSRFATLYSPDPTARTAAGRPAFRPQPAAYQSPAEQIDANYRMGYSTPLFSPTGGLKISARDLARYMLMHMNAGADPATGTRILNKETARLMQTDAVQIDPHNSYCLALRHTLNLIPGERMTGHTGSAYGLISALFFEPEKKFGFVMMTNGVTPEYARKTDGYARIQREVITLLHDSFIR